MFKAKVVVVLLVVSLLSTGCFKGSANPEQQLSRFQMELSSEGKILCDLYQSALSARNEIASMQALDTSYRAELAKQEKILVAIDRTKPKAESNDYLVNGVKYTKAQIEQDAKLRRQRCDFLHSDIQESELGVGSYSEVLASVLPLIDRVESSLQKQGKKDDMKKAALVAVCRHSQLGEETDGQFKLNPADLLGEAQQRFWSELHHPLDQVMALNQPDLGFSKSLIDDSVWLAVLTPAEQQEIATSEKLAGSEPPEWLSSYIATKSESVSSVAGQSNGSVEVNTEAELGNQDGTSTVTNPKNINYMQMVHRMIADGPDSPVWNAAQKLRNTNAGNLGYYALDPADSVGLVANPYIKKLSDTTAETAVAAQQATDQITKAMADIAAAVKANAETNAVNANRLDEMVDLQREIVHAIRELEPESN